MIQQIVVTILISLAFSVTPRAAAEGRMDRNSTDRDESRAISSLFKTVSTVDTLKCTPRCEGHKGCSRHHDIDTCISDSNARGCFWSCE